LKQTILEWHRDKALSLSAALAFYTVFALAPLLIVVIAIVGQIFGQAAIEGRISSEFRMLIGPDAAAQSNSDSNAYKPRSGVIAAAIGIRTLCSPPSAFRAAQGRLN
jgi:membrane protein